MMKKESRVIKVAAIGPESSGKTTLCRDLAERFGTVYVREAVRGYLRKGGRITSSSDLYYAAQRQIRAESFQLKKAKDVLFCDTELINLKVWSEICFQGVDPRLMELVNTHQYDFYLLTKPDIPWSQDGLRQNEAERPQMFELYRTELLRIKVPFLEVSAVGPGRVKEVECCVKSLINLE